MTAVVDHATRAELKHKVISTDSHVDVPGDEIAKRVPEEFREKIALIRLSEDDAEDAAVVKMRKRMERMMAKMDEEDLERNRAGGWDPELRIRDQDREGVHGEVYHGGAVLESHDVLPVEEGLSAARNRRVEGSSPSRRCAETHRSADESAARMSGRSRPATVPV